jgi:hypothetical protein
LFQMTSKGHIIQLERYGHRIKQTFVRRIQVGKSRMRRLMHRVHRVANIILSAHY